MRKKAMEDYLIEFYPSGNGSLKNKTKTITVRAVSCHVIIKIEYDLGMLPLSYLVQDQQVQ